MSVTVDESLTMPGKIGAVAEQECTGHQESGEENDTKTAYTAYSDKTSTVDLERDRGSLQSSLLSPRSSSSSSSPCGLVRGQGRSGDTNDDSQTRRGHYIPHHIWQASLQAQSRARSQSLSSSSSSKAPAWTRHARANSDSDARTKQIVHTQTMAGPAQKLSHQQQVAVARKPCHCKGCRDARKPSLSIGLGATHMKSSLVPIEEADKEAASPTALSYDNPHAPTSHSGLQRKGSLLGRALSLNTRGKLSESGVIRSRSQCRRGAPTTKDISRPARITKEQEKEEEGWLAAFGDGIPIPGRAQVEKENVGPVLSTSPHARADIPPAKGCATTATTLDHAVRLKDLTMDSIQPSCEAQSPSPSSTRAASSIFVPLTTNAPRRPPSSTLEPVLEQARAPLASFIASSLVSQTPSISEYHYSNATYTTSPTISDHSRRFPSVSVTSSPSSVYSCNSSTPTSVRSLGSGKYPRALTRRKPSPRWEDILKEEELKVVAPIPVNSGNAGNIVPDAPKLAGLEDVQPFGRGAPSGQTGTEMEVEVPFRRKEWDCRDSAEPSTFSALQWMAEEDWVENDRPLSYGYGVEMEADPRGGSGGQVGSSLAPFGLGRDAGQWATYSRRENVVAQST